MSFVDDLNNVHVGFIQKLPILWLPDGGDLRSLFGENAKTVPKKALPQHLLIGDGSKDKGLLLVNMDACILSLVTALNNLNFDGVYSDLCGSLDDVLDVCDQISTAIEEDEEENKHLTDLTAWQLDKNFINMGALSSIYTEFNNYWVDQFSRSLKFDFDEQFKVTMGLFIALEMPTDHCLDVPELRNFCSLLKMVDKKDFLTNEFNKYLGFFSGVLKSNMIGKMNKKGTTTWGYDLNLWSYDNVNKEPLGSKSGM